MKSFFSIIKLIFVIFFKCFKVFAPLFIIFQYSGIIAIRYPLILLFGCFFIFTILTNVVFIKYRNKSYTRFREQGKKMKIIQKLQFYIILFGLAIPNKFLVKNDVQHIIIGVILLILYKKFKFHFFGPFILYIFAIRCLRYAFCFLYSFNIFWYKNYINKYVLRFAVQKETRLFYKYFLDDAIPIPKWYLKKKRKKRDEREKRGNPELTTWEKIGDFFD